MERLSLGAAPRSGCWGMVKSTQAQKVHPVMSLGTLGFEFCELFSPPQCS